MTSPSDRRHDIATKNYGMTISQRFCKRRQSALLFYVGLGILGVGFTLRIAKYATNRSLWIDEAMLALNIVGRSFLELTQPLSYNQGAPIGFLFIEKLAIQALGNHDYILRLFPLVTGLVSLLVMYKVATNVLGTAGMLVATGLFAVSGELIYYTSEAKQYSSDALAAVLLLVIGCQCLKVETYPRYYFALMASGVACMWISHPAVFILVGVGSGLACNHLFRSDRRRLLWLGLVFLIWLITFVLLYYISLRHLAVNAPLIYYWRWDGAFMPMSPRLAADWLPKAFVRMFHDPVGLVGRLAITVGIAVFVVGCLSLMFRRWQLAVILLVPFPIVLLASRLEKYPFSERLLLFLLPATLLLIGEGIDRIRSLSLKISFHAALSNCLILGIVLFYRPTILAAQTLWHPNMGEHIKPIMSYIKEHKCDTDFIYVYYGAGPAFSYYAPFYNFEQKDYYVGVESRQELTKYVEDLDKLLVYKRVWVVFSHVCEPQFLGVFPRCVVPEEPYLLRQLDRLGKRADMFSERNSGISSRKAAQVGGSSSKNQFQSTGASVYLYSFSSAQH
jgi:hypothetical protein